MRVVGDDKANAGSIGLIIAAIITAGAFMAAEYVISPTASTDAGSSTMGAQARSAADLVIQDSGRTATGADWTSDPDHMTRFGLALQSSPNFLDYAKIRALRYGNMTTDPTNGAPDYPEVRAALGITTGDVHIRTYPALPTLDDPRWSKDVNGRVAYFGSYTGGVTAANLSTAFVKTSSSLNVSATITNQGSAPAVYGITFALAAAGDDNHHDGHDGNQEDDGEHSNGEDHSHDHEDRNGDGYDDSHHDDSSDHETGMMEDRHTRLLQPGESQTVWANFWALPSWESDVQKVKISVEDEFGNTAKDLAGHTIGPLWLRQTPPAASGNTFNILASADDLYYVTGATVKFDVDHYTGEDQHVKNPQARLVLLGPNGNEWVNTTINLPTKDHSVYTYSCANCTALGTYTLKVWDTGMKRMALDQVYVSDSKLFTSKSAISAIASKEVGYVADLVTNFNPTRYDAATNPQGDVFADDVNGPSDITGVLARYSTLIVGSEVSQTALTPSATKNGIADWVTSGGNLIVLGTVKQQSRWLDPIYHASQTNANGGISAPDPTHAILTAPERLQYQRYNDNGRAWSILTDQPFTDVLTRGGDSQATVNTLAVSNPGSFNNGTVALTSYEPGSLMSPQDDLEAKRLMHNLMSQSYTMLFLDFGPPIPTGVPVGSEARLAAIPHPNVPGAVVPVRVVVYSFG